MKQPTLHSAKFLVHIQKRPGFDAPVLLKEPAREQLGRSQLEELHNEFAITRRLAGVVGVRPALAKKGTESRPVLLMEYIKGRSLAEQIHTGDLDLAAKLRLAMNVAEALGHVHNHHVIHQDLTSGNILIADNDSPGSAGGVYIIDFGIASIAGKQKPTLRAVDETRMGTLAYISPEQTGRMNRRLDYRTDLYSLGVTLYELFTGQLPFVSSDMLELIHDHIARNPKPPLEIEPGIPGPVSDIVLKLLAKDPDDRYQTARGLQADLKRCLDQWEREGRIKAFGLGDDDVTSRLHIPHRLYGRRAEVERLESILDLAFTKHAQLLLVAGYSGVGKTSLVREIRKDIIAKQGVFIEGKFDPLRRAQPYSAWEQAFTQLANSWLGQTGPSITGWRDTILNAVGDHGQVLIDVIPALERVLGPQPTVPELGGVEHQNRINFVFNRFITCLATTGHPLTVFLDDLQWIDPASLQLIEALFAVKPTSRLLVVGAFRSNEVGTTHPLTISQARMQTASDQVTTLVLKEPPPEAMNRLLADSLHLSEADCRDLCHILMQKSAGNPFYFRQLLYSLEAEQLLKFNRAEHSWIWDEGVDKRLHACESVTDLLVKRMQTLTARTQYALSIAGCVGNRFALSTLGTIIGRPPADILMDLGPAQQAGLIIELNELHAFVHDHIQEAAYSLIPESDRPKTHLKIGRLLWAQMTPENVDQEIFTIVGHLNAGRVLIDESSETTELAALNLRAGQKAMTASAYSDAKIYIETGLELLGPDSWSEQYELTLSLHNENGELACLTGQFDQVAPTAALIHANAKNILDRVRIYMVQIEAATAESQVADGLNCGLSALRELDVYIPLRPTSEVGQRLHEKLVGLLTSEPMEQLSQLPQMSDEGAMAASALLASIMSTSYIANPPLFPIICYHGAILTFEFGVDVWSPFFVGGVALVDIASITPDTSDEDARRLIAFTKLLLQMTQALLDKPITIRSRTKGLLMLTFTTPWFQTYEDSIKYSRATYDSASETGDWLYASYGVTLFADQAFAAGMDLPEYRNQLSAYADSLRKTGQVMSPTILAIPLQSAANFMAPSAEPHRLIGVSFNEEEWLSQSNAADDFANRQYLSIFKLLLAYHFDRVDSLDEYAAEAERLLSAGPCRMSVAEFYLYQTLARLRQVRAGNATQHSDAVELVSKNLRWMRLWAETNPSTFQHRYDLLAAERARVTGDIEGALSHYERAINGARTSGFTHEEALANELYARFWLERDNNRFASPLMREAHSLYLKWGAAAKATYLTERFPTLLIGDSVIFDKTAARTLSEVIPAELDLRTVLKVSQDIAGELSLQSLLTRLMSNAIENTGAQRGFLILEREGRWMIEARASVDESKPYTKGIEDITGCDQLAQSIVRYAARTHETVVLADASRSGQFVHDPYIQSHKIRSVLCLPLINQGKTSAILYLENNLAPHVFSHQRITLLKTLSSQMAISIDNAQIHAELENLLESRSKALASAEAQVRTLFDNSPLGIALTSPEGKFLSVNRTMMNMVRTTEEELLERSVIDFYADPNDRDALLSVLKETGVLQDFGVHLLRYDGSSFYASLNISKLVLEGNEILLTMVQDVTAQISAEQENAIVDERARLARELHDAVSQTILSSSLLADATARNWEAGHGISTGDLKKLSRMLQGALDEMRTLLLELRPAALRNATLGELLGALVETTRSRSRMTVDLAIRNDHTLPERVTTTLLRIAQEGINNAIQHASATTIKVDLITDPDRVVLRVADDGQGFNVDRHTAGHHGLEIINERADEIGAALEIESRVGSGTQITVTWS